MTFTGLGKCSGKLESTETVFEQTNGIVTFIIIGFRSTLKEGIVQTVSVFIYIRTYNIMDIIR